MAAMILPDEFARERDTVSFYDKRADLYESMPDAGYPPHYQYLLGELRCAGAPTVIDIGCGSGRAVTMVEMFGARYIGIDPAYGLITLARSKFPGRDFRCIDVRMLASRFSQKADAFIANFSLHHLEREHMLDALHNIRAVMRDGALGALGVPYGTEVNTITPDRFPVLEKDGRMLEVMWTRELLTPYLAEAGFEEIVIGMPSHLYHPDIFFCAVRAI